MPKVKPAAKSRGLRPRLAKIWLDWRGVLLFVVIMLVFRSAVADWNQVPSGSMKPSILAGDRIVVDKLAWDLRLPFTDQRLVRWADPARGDVVTFENPLDGRLFVKRVVAVPGDEVRWQRKTLQVNGEQAAYTPLAADEIGELPIDEAGRYHFYRERLLGSERIVMLHGAPGVARRDEALASAASRADRCAQFESVAKAAGEVLARAVCRCANRGLCSSLPPFTVPAGKYWMMGDYRDNSSDSRVIGFVDRRQIYGRAHAIAFSVDKSRYYQPRLGRFFTDLP